MLRTELDMHAIMGWWGWQNIPFKNRLLAYFLKKASWMTGRAM